MSNPAPIQDADSYESIPRAARCAHTGRKAGCVPLSFHGEKRSTFRFAPHFLFGQNDGIANHG
jgi:hypothetical protein